MATWLPMQGLQQAILAYAKDAGSYTAAKQLLSYLHSLREAAEARPKVWLAYATAHSAVLPALMAGLLQWKLASAMESVLQLFALLLPSPEVPKEGMK